MKNFCRFVFPAKSLQWSYYVYTLLPIVLWHEVYQRCVTWAWVFALTDAIWQNYFGNVILPSLFCFILFVSLVNFWWFHVFLLGIGHFFNLIFLQMSDFAICLLVYLGSSIFKAGSDWCCSMGSRTWAHREFTSVIMLVSLHNYGSVEPFCWVLFFNFFLQVLQFLVVFFRNYSWCDELFNNCFSNPGFNNELRKHFYFRFCRFSFVNFSLSDWFLWHCGRYRNILKPLTRYAALLQLISYRIPKLQYIIIIYIAFLFQFLQNQHGNALKSISVYDNKLNDNKFNENKLMMKL